MDIGQIESTIFLLEQAVKSDNFIIKKSGKKSKQYMDNIVTEIENYKTNKKCNRQIKQSIDKITNEKYSEQMSDNCIMTDIMTDGVVALNKTISTEKINKIIKSINKKNKK
jgi:hypothetical protein